MTTMVDEIFDRQYQSGRDQLNAGIDAAIGRLTRSIDASFKTLQAIQFAAPWAARKSARFGHDA